MRKRLSQSAERLANQSSIKHVPSEQKQAAITDTNNEIEYIEDIIQLMARVNRTQYNDVAQLKHALKTQNSVYLSLLQLIASIIDPYFEIKSFSDERFQLFLKRLGYPCKNMSKTRFMSLGSSHTYLHSLQILSWLAKVADQILNINERVESGNYTAMEIESESNTNKIKKLLAEYLASAYNGSSNIDDKQLERTIREAKNKLNNEVQRLAKESNKLSNELHVLKLNQPDVHTLEQQLKTTQTEHNELTTQLQTITQQIEKTRTEMESAMKQYLEVDNDLAGINQQISQKKQLIHQQPIKIDQARDLQYKEHQYVVMAQKQIEDIQGVSAQLESLRNRRSDILVEIQQLVQLLNKDKMRISKEFDIFYSIPVNVQLQESDRGINHVLENEMLLDMEYVDLEFEQKMMNENSNNNFNKRKSMQAYDSILRRDDKAVLQLMIPNKKQIKEEFQQQKSTIESQLQQVHQQIINLYQESSILQKEIEELNLEQEKQFQEISHLNDSTEELKMMRQIYQEHSQKQQGIQKEIEQRKIEIKINMERTSLEELDIQRAKKKLIDFQEATDKFQAEAEQIEESNQKLQIAYKQWVTEQLEAFLNKVKDPQ